MKYLIISASIGEGHVKAAEALTKRLKNKGNKTKHIDILNYINNSTGSFFSKTYFFLVTKTPFLWRILYKLTDNNFSKKLTAWLVRIFIKKDQIKSILGEYSPDKIICTHFLPSYITSSSVDITIPVTTLITDYGVHYLWLAEAKEYRVATQKLKEDLIKRGIEEKKIKIKKLPVDPTFDKKGKKKKLKEKLDLPNDPLVLLLSGGQGMLDTTEIISNLFKLQEQFTLVAIAGKNENLKNKLKQKQAPKNITYKVLGWVEQIDKFMKSAELVISKPGGMTVTECVKTNTPLLGINPIPGQEESNLNYILENESGYKAETLKDINKKTRELITD